MDTLLSPKQVAQALRVSESSVKRWCDKGSIATTYTDGGHRRIRMGDLAEFVRTNRLVVQDFVPMGLGQNGPKIGAVEDAGPELVRALLAGDEDRSSQIIMELYLSKVPIHEICDQVIVSAFYQMGEQWVCGQAEIYQERLGCKIAQRVLHRLQILLPEPPERAPIAIGCASEGDPYNLGSTMVELVFRDAGWRAVSLGENIPLTSLALAIEQHRPSVVWLSCSYLPDVEKFVLDFNCMVEANRASVKFAIGGRALTDEVRGSLHYDFYGQCMQDIYGYANNLKTVQ